MTYKDDPFIGNVTNWPEKWVFGIDKDGNVELGTKTSNDIAPFSYTGTAFFISKDGELGTNRHIACPWEYIQTENKEIFEKIRQTMEDIIPGRDYVLIQSILEDINNKKCKLELDKVDGMINRLKKSPYEISGSFQYLGVAFTGTNITTLSDLAACQVMAESGDEEKDVALLRLNSKKTPEDIVKAGYFDIEKARLDEQTLIPQEDELTTIGYPAQYGVSLFTKQGQGVELQPTVHRTYISKTPTDNQFQMQSNVVGGQSGSPIVDKDHRLVGVVWGSHRGTDFAYACNIKHLKEIYDKYKARQ